VVVKIIYAIVLFLSSGKFDIFAMKLATESIFSRICEKNINFPIKETSLDLSEIRIIFAYNVKYMIS